MTCCIWFDIHQVMTFTFETLINNINKRAVRQAEG